MVLPTAQGLSMPAGSTKEDMEKAEEKFNAMAKIDDMATPQNSDVFKDEGYTTLPFPPVDGIPPIPMPEETMPIDQFMGQQAVNPVIPEQGLYKPIQQQVQSGELIDPNTGKLIGDVASPTAQADAFTAEQLAGLDATTYDAVLNKAAPKTEVATGTIDERSLVDPAQQTLTERAQAATGEVVGTVDPGLRRDVGESEKIQGAKADTSFLGDTQAQESDFVSNIQGATMEITPDMTVEGQLSRLSAQFTDGQVPAWAAGAIRTANSQMAARGLGASSMAGAAILQAAMESALPIAVQDSQSYYKTAAQIMNNEQQARLTNTQNNLNIDLANTSNRQQMALAKMQVNASLAGQELSNQQQANVLNAEKFAEAANITFNFEQQRQFANSKMMETMNLQNLSFEQSTALANAASLANLDMANLNTRQQAAVQNAKAFLGLDMATLSNTQQANVINQQAQQQVMLSDQAAENLARQTNAASMTDVDKSMAMLAQDINKHNSQVLSANAQANAGQANAMSQFRANMQNNREQYNATRALEIETSTTAWRRQTNTVNTAAQNAANQVAAADYLSISNTAQNNIWQQFRDEADYAYSSSENSADRAFNMAMAVLEADVNKERYNEYLDQQTASSLGSFLTSLGVAYIQST